MTGFYSLHAAVIFHIIKKNNSGALLLILHLCICSSTFSGGGTWTNEDSSHNLTSQHTNMPTSKLCGLLGQACNLAFSTERLTQVNMRRQSWPRTSGAQCLVEVVGESSAILAGQHSNVHHLTLETAKQ